ncbi:MAG: aspartyl-trna synthetase [Alphaproteobacteria bacterium]|nr:aspartyl-trna synthetase [Alphaproteobacteria bacterium]
MRLDSLLLAALLSLVTVPAAAAPDAPPSPYVSIRRDKAFMREGPSYAHRILWVYQHKDYPFRVIATYDAWRRVRAVDGTTGWMHHSQLSERRTVLFIGFTKSALRTDADPNAKIVAYAQPGVVARLKACEPRFCEVDADGTDGWVDKRNIWGVGVGEVFH